MISFHGEPARRLRDYRRRSTIFQALSVVSHTIDALARPKLEERLISKFSPLQNVLPRTNRSEQQNLHEGKRNFARLGITKIELLIFDHRFTTNNIPSLPLIPMKFHRINSSSPNFTMSGRQTGVVLEKMFVPNIPVGSDARQVSLKPARSGRLTSPAAVAKLNKRARGRNSMKFRRWLKGKKMISLNPRPSSLFFRRLGGRSFPADSNRRPGPPPRPRAATGAIKSNVTRDPSSDTERPIRGAFLRFVTQSRG